MLTRFRSDWPFAARRVPLFYGWVIWLLSTAGFLLSVPGQTMGMGVFTDYFLAHLGLTRTELSWAYFGGTVLSATLLTRAGRAFDRYGARVMVVGACLGLALVLLAMAGLDQAAGALATQLGLTLAWLTGPLIFLCYFGVRFTGQGVLTSASVNVLLLWFERRRGLVSGLRGVFVSLGFAAAPLLLALLIDDHGWRGTLILLAGAVAVFSVIAALLLRDTPAVCGLAPDGIAPITPTAQRPETAAQGDTLQQARRTLEYWAYCLGLAMHALFGTAMTFHIVDLFASAGRDAAEAYRYFLPAAIVSTSVNLIASTLADRLPMKPFLIAMLSLFALGAVGMLQLSSDWGYWSLVIGFGAGGGLWVVISNLAFVRHHGTAHLGEISGFNTAVTVFASAIGPVAFSIAREAGTSYNEAITGCLIAITALFAVSCFIPNRGRPPNP
ncbi:MAG: MFS transporter [Pseudomonadota bacterium]